MSKKIYVGNLAWAVSSESLRTLFSQYGNVLSSNVIEDRETGRSRGFGFVEMENEDAARAIEALNGAAHEGRTLKVNEAQPRESRPRRW